MHMRTKFAMFPSGIVFFPEVVNHDECEVSTPTKERERVIAAGYAYIDSSKQGVDSIILEGRSINLGLGADSAYPDWREKFTSSGFPVQRKHYQAYNKNAYFLPFQLIGKFDVWGIGKGTTEEVCVLNDLVESIQ